MMILTLRILVYSEWHISVSDVTNDLTWTTPERLLYMWLDRTSPSFKKRLHLSLASFWTRSR